MSLPCPVSDLIPQKGKMGFDQILVKAKTDDGESTVIIDENNIFLDDHNRLSNIVLIEYINQLTASIRGYNQKYTNQAPQKGLFVGLQEAEFLQPVHLGDLLTLKAFTTEEVQQVNFIQGLVYRAGERIAQLVTKIYEVKDLFEFDSLTNQGQIPQKKNDVILNGIEPPAYLPSSMHRQLYAYLLDTKIGDDFISFNIACPEEFAAFDGHFPENPILPGVILLEICNLALEILMKEPIIIKKITKMKISGVVLPNQVISCSIKIDRNTGSLPSFTTVLKKEEREISRFNGYFDKEENHGEPKI